MRERTGPVGRGGEHAPAARTAAAPPALPAAVLALQQSAGNQAVVRTLARAPTVGSFESAWEAFKRDHEASVVGFLAAILEGRTPGFSLSDLQAVAGDARVKAFFDQRWRDVNGAQRVGQTIQGQHEWLPTVMVGYVLQHAPVDDIARWMQALDILRTPTHEVLFSPSADADTVAAVNANPTGHTTASFGMSGHSAAIYERRASPSKRGDANRMLSKGSPGLHKHLEALIRQHLGPGRADLEGLMAAVRAYQEQQVWGGDVQGLDPQAAAQVPGDLFRGGSAQAPLYGTTMADLQGQASAAKDRNRGIMANRTNALLDHPALGSSHWATLRQEGPVYVRDASGRTVDDYTDADLDASEDDDAEMDFEATHPPPESPPADPLLAELHRQFEEQLRALDARYMQIQLQAQSSAQMQSIAAAYLQEKQLLDTLLHDALVGYGYGVGSPPAPGPA